MARTNINVGTTANDGTGDTLRDAFVAVNSMTTEIYGNNFVTHDMLNDDIVDHDELANRYTAVASITDLTGPADYDCSTASVFKLSGDIIANYEIDLLNYKKGQIITIYPIKGSFTVTLDAEGTSTNTFNKLAESDYDGASSNILQIECVDDSASDPVFFYSVTTFASDSTI